MNLSKQQKQIIITILAAVVLLGASAAIYFATRPATTPITTDTSEISANTGVGTPNFNDYADYVLELKDGENLITEGGIYAVSGNINGYIHINLTDDKNVKLILSNTEITSSGAPAIFIENAKNAVIELVGENKIAASVANKEHPSAIFSKDDLLIEGDGSLDVVSDEDAIVSHDDLEIANGKITISCSDDAIRGNDSVKISGGDVTVEKSKEGIESEVIVISGGTTSVTATDDGLNAADKNSEGNALSITITGGNNYINSGGDGIDSNGAIYISGGTTYVDGPTNNGNGALDYEEKMEVTGGTLVAVGAAGMAVNATASTQPSVLVGLTNNATGALSINDISYTPKKSYASVYVTSPSLKVGETYDLKTGSATTSVTISNNITNVNISGMGGMMPGGQGGGTPPAGRR